MKRIVQWMLIAMATTCLAAPALAGGNANFILGGRGLDKDFWEPANGQFVIGAQVDFGKMDWPIHLETGMQVSVGGEEDFFGTADVYGSVAELDFGVNKTWELKGPARPFIGGGLAAVGASITIEAPLNDIDDDDDSGGAYFHGGVFWRIGSRFNIGIDGRVLVGTNITLFGEDGDADYAQLGMILGWGWPATSK
jgi:hypothetical protein